MANVDLSDLSQLTTPADADKLLVTDDSEAGGEKSKYITYENFYTHLLAMSFCHRAQFEYSTTTAILIGAARYYHKGTTAQLVYWDSQLTLTCANLSASDISYIYIDDSAVVTLGDNLLTETEFIDSTTAPTWSAANHGWYNGADMCIFAVRTNSDSEIAEFWHCNDLMLYGGGKAIKSDWDATTTWQDVDFSNYVPSFAQDIQATFGDNYSDTSTALYWRVNGSTTTDGHEIMRINANTDRSYSTLRVISDTSQIIEVKRNYDGAEVLDIWCNGWYFPTGM